MLNLPPILCPGAVGAPRQKEDAGQGPSPPFSPLQHAPAWGVPEVPPWPGHTKVGAVPGAFPAHEDKHGLRSQTGRQPLASTARWEPTPATGPRMLFFTFQPLPNAPVFSCHPASQNKRALGGVLPKKQETC